MSDANVVELLKNNPELRDQALKIIDDQIDDLQAQRAEIADGGAPAKSKSSNKMKHTEAVLDALSDGPLDSRGIKAAAEAKGHDFKSGLGTTLHNLSSDGRIKYKQKKDSNQYIYSV